MEKDELCRPVELDVSTACRELARAVLQRYAREAREWLSGGGSIQLECPVIGGSPERWDIEVTDEGAIVSQFFYSQALSRWMEGSLVYFLTSEDLMVSDDAPVNSFSLAEAISSWPVAKMRVVAAEAGIDLGTADPRKLYTFVWEAVHRLYRETKWNGEDEVQLECPVPNGAAERWVIRKDEVGTCISQLVYSQALDCYVDGQLTYYFSYDEEKELREEAGFSGGRLVVDYEAAMDADPLMRLAWVMRRWPKSEEYVLAAGEVGIDI